MRDRKLLRLPDRMVEWEFLEELLPAENGKPAVWIIGYSDLCVGNNTIIDHKSCKDFRWTCNEDPKDAKRYVGQDVQLNCYGYYLAKHKHEKEGIPLPDHVRVQHVQYGYEDERVKTATADTPWDKVLEIMEELKDTARIIRDSRAEKEDFDKVECNLSACGAFGGCKFKNICGGMEDPEDYKERTNEAIKLNNELRQSKNKENTQMSSEFDDLLSQLEATTPGTSVETVAETPSAPETPKVEAPKEEPPAPTTPKVIEPKDAVTKADIMACMKQLETNMAPMGIDVNTIPAYQDLQVKLDVIMDEEAKQRAEAAAAEAKAKVDAEAKAKEEEAKQEALRQQPEKAVAQNEAAKETPAEVITAEPTDVELTKVKEARTSLRKGFVLLINATSHSYTNTVNIASVYADVAEKVKEHNADLNGAQVHATVIASASDIAEKMLKGHCVIASTMNDVHRDLANELVQYADVVAYGVQPS